MKAVDFRLPSDVAEKLQQIADAAGKSLDDVVRVAVAQAVVRAKKEKLERRMFGVRLPVELYATLTDLAKGARRSLNSEITVRLRRSVDEHRTI